MPIKTLLGWFGIMTLTVSVQAADIHTPDNDAYTVAPGTSTVTSPPQAPPKRRHRRKSIPSNVSSSTTTFAPPNNTDAPGMSDSLGTNDPGAPNMGTSDHVPGTTGTSGQ